MDAIKTALVTGASEGIGKEFAQRLAEQGYQITLVARNSQRLEETRGQLKGTGHTCIAADLSETAGLEKIQKLINKNKFNLLINNAGFGHYDNFSQSDFQKTLSMLRLNIEALVVLSYAFLQTAQKGDALLNVSSTLAFVPLPGSAVYAATKAFVTSFSESLWVEESRRGIFVMNLCPGITETNFHTRAGGKDTDKPPKMLAQTPDQVVEVALCALQKRNQPTVISGLPNYLMGGMTRLLSRKTMVKAMGRFSVSKSK